MVEPRHPPRQSLLYLPGEKRNSRFLSSGLNFARSSTKCRQNKILIAQTCKHQVRLHPAFNQFAFHNVGSRSDTDCNRLALPDFVLHNAQRLVQRGDEKVDDSIPCGLPLSCNIGCCSKRRAPSHVPRDHSCTTDWSQFANIKQLPPETRLARRIDFGNYRTLRQCDIRTTSYHLNRIRCSVACRLLAGLEHGKGFSPIAGTGDEISE